MKEEREIKFGTIVTNGINYWMCVVDMRTKCECGRETSIIQKFTPVVVDSVTKEPKYLVAPYDQRDIGTIKPYAQLV